jgi:hypothetical protein
MNTYIGDIISAEIIENLDGSNKVRMLKVEITEGDDTKTLQQVLYAGQDDGVVEGATAYIIEIHESFLVCIGIDDGIEPEVDDGEKKIYSQASGVIKAFIHLLNTGEINNQNDNGFYKLKDDGEINLNGDDDFVTAFNKMKTAFDQLKSDFDAHTHLFSYNAGPTPSSGNTNAIAVGSTADMADAKVSTVKVKLP